MLPNYLATVWAIKMWEGVAVDIINLSEEQQNRLIDEIGKHSDDLTEEDMEFLKVLSKSKFSDVKINMAGILVNCETPESVNVLLSMVDDEDDLVRVNAIDSLCNCQDVKVMKILMEIAQKDNSELVRRYAILSAVDIADNIEKCDYTAVAHFLKQRAKRESDIGIKLACYRLYLFDDKNYLTQLEMGLLDADYRNRCATVHGLSEIADSKNSEHIRNILIKAREAEKIYTVTDAIDHALSEMQ